MLTCIRGRNGVQQQARAPRHLAFSMRVHQRLRKTHIVVRIRMLCVMVCMTSVFATPCDSIEQAIDTYGHDLARIADSRWADRV
jgi:hypothetical protein